MGEPLATILIADMVTNRTRLETYMEQEGSRVLHEEFMLAESGTLPGRHERLTNARLAGARAWLRHLAASLCAVWDGGPPDMQQRLEGWVQGARERAEAFELEEYAALEKEGLAGDAEADARRVTLSAHMRLFGEGVGTIAAPAGSNGPSFCRELTAVLRREEPRRREIEAQSYAAWSGSPVEGVLEETRVTAAPPEPGEIRMREAAAVWSYIHVTTEALGEVLEALGVATPRDGSGGPRHG